MNHKDRKMFAQEIAEEEAEQLRENKGAQVVNVKTNHRGPYIECVAKDRLAKESLQAVLSDYATYIDLVYNGENGGD